MKLIQTYFYCGHLSKSNTLVFNMDTGLQGFQFRPANGEFRQTLSFKPTQIRQSFYV
jgi:hypothetical protein